MKRLEGKVVIVTGGARGLGKAFCLAFSKAGADVVVADILDREAEQTAEEIRAKGGVALSLKTDVTCEEDTLRMAEKVIKEFGSIDVLVNNAALLLGISRKPFVEIPITEWDRLMAVNLKGAFLCSRAVLKKKKKQGRGKIVNISSATAFTGSTNWLHYVTSKAGLIGLTRCLASELGQFGICVNAVAPGFTDTEASRTVARNAARRDMNIMLTPLGRLEQPEDVTGTVLFLASAESDFMTGQALVVDGGRVMH